MRPFRNRPQVEAITQPEALDLHLTIQSSPHLTNSANAPLIDLDEDLISGLSQPPALTSFMDSSLQSTLHPVTTISNVQPVILTHDFQSTLEGTKVKDSEVALSGTKDQHILTSRPDDSKSHTTNPMEVTPGSVTSYFAKYNSEANDLEYENLHHTKPDSSIQHQNHTSSSRVSFLSSRSCSLPCKAPDLRPGAILFNDPHFARFSSLLCPDQAEPRETGEPRLMNPEDHRAHSL